MKKGKLFEDKLIIQNKGEALLLKKDEIICLNAEGNYTEIVTTEHKQYYISKKLGYMHDKICNEHFYRINRSQIVNVKYLHEIDFKNRIMKLTWNGKEETYTVSRRRLKELRELLNEDNR